MIEEDRYEQHNIDKCIFTFAGGSKVSSENPFSVRSLREVRWEIVRHSTYIPLLATPEYPDVKNLGLTTIYRTHGPGRRQRLR